MDEAELQPEMQTTPVDSPLPGSADASEATSPGGPGGSETVELEWHAHSRVLSLVFNTQGPVWQYVIRAGLLSFIPTVVIAFLLGVATGGSGEGMPHFNRAAGVVLLFVSVVIISPVVETLLLGLTLWIVSFVTKRPLRQALVACVIWAVLHSLAAWLWGLVVIWPFFVFSCAYLAWRRRSWWHAMGVVCGIHMFQNLLPGILIAAT
jgi:hypothetical protein